MISLVAWAIAIIFTISVIKDNRQNKKVHNMPLVQLTTKQAQARFNDGGEIHIKTQEDTIGLAWSKGVAPTWSTLVDDYYKGETLWFYVQAMSSHNTVTGKVRWSEK
jgi:hypothetical protein